MSRRHSSFIENSMRRCEILNSLEKSSEPKRGKALKKEKNTKSSRQLGFSDVEKESLVKEIQNIDILNMTPMDGFNKLYDIIKRAKSI